MWIVRATDRLTRLLMILGAIWAFGLCFVALSDIVLRMLDMPITGTKEIVANSVVIIVFMQVGYAVRAGAMLRADFLVAMMPPFAQKMLLAMAYLLGALFFLFLLDAAVPHAIRSYTRGEFDGIGALQVPVWPARWAIVVGSALAGFNYLLIVAVDVFDLRVDRMDL